MARFEHIVFVCTKERAADDPKGSCAVRGSHGLLDRMKQLVSEHKLKGRVRVASSGCLDYCAKGCTVAIFSAKAPAPETWYTRLASADADSLFRSHILEGKRLDDKVERSGDSQQEEE